jgi:hypothetical protein
VVRGYTFLSRNYADGDQIYLTGFSRGSYTARALAGLIAKQGLLDARKLDLQDKETAYRLGSAVWYQHQRSLHIGFLGDLESFVDDLPGFLNRAPSPENLVEVPIRAVAVWDTVGALGIPSFAAEQKRLDMFRFVDTALDPKVACALHAVAVDEARADFTPTLWNPDPRVTQVLFPGAHADVGGGYPVANRESGLSDGALLWMEGRLVAEGLRLAPPSCAPDPEAPAHRPWSHFPWTALPSGPRTFPAGLALHRSVLARLGKPVVAEPGLAPQPYAPANLQAYLAGGRPLPGVAVEG